MDYLKIESTSTTQVLSKSAAAMIQSADAVLTAREPALLPPSTAPRDETAYVPFSRRLAARQQPDA